MDLAYILATALHIGAGTGALGLGTVIAFRRKGDAVHRKLGVWFVYCMMAVAATAVGMALINPNTFLLLIALFSGYMAYMGRRTMMWPGKRDAGYLPSVLLLLVGIGQLVLAAAGWSESVALSLVFGLGISAMATNELRMTRASHAKPLSRSKRLQRHITLMGGALISAWTAFIVVNAPPWLGLIGWIAPSVVGGAMIALATRKHAGRQETGQQ